jgi:hypothetical protein
VIFRAVNAVMAVLFFVSAALQYNDPDPVQWMAIYGAAGLLAALAAWGRTATLGAPVLVAAVAIAWSAFIATHLHGHFAWHHLVESMHAGTPQIEESRESLGLAIVAAWMLVLVFAGRGRRAA